jgi:hypothetical protein
MLPTFTATLLELGEPTKADFVTFSQILGAEPAITLPDEDETRLSLLALSPGDTFRGVTAIAARVHSVCTDAADSGSATGDEDPTDEDPTEAEPEDSETESGPSLLDFLPDNSRVQLGFLTHEYSPPIAPYTAGFDIEFNAETGEIKMTQQPSNQETKGPSDPTTFVYVTTDGNVEVYVGVVCPRPDGSYFIAGYTFGGAESIAETFQSLMDSIPGLDVSLDPPQSISVDPASAPNCDEFISNPSELGYWMRTNLGPPGPIPGAQWDLAFATTP